MNLFQPWTSYGSEGLQQGFFRLWNPYLCNGEPFLANIQIAVLYPLKIFFYLFPFIWGLKLFIIGHFFLGGFFLYLFFRQAKFNIKASFIGSLIFMLSGFMLVQIEFFSVLSSMIWFALLFVIINKTTKSKENIYFVIAAGVLSIQFLAGYTFIFFYTNLILVFYLLWHKKWPFSLKYNFMWLLVIGMISVQLWPTFELMGHGIRSVWTYEEASTWSLPPLFLIKFLLPDLFGKACLPALFPQPFGTEYYAIKQYWLTTFYLGILPLFFIFYSWRGKKQDYFWEIVALFALFLSMSAFFPITRYYYKYMPLAKNFTHPASFMFFTVFGLVLFITRGLDKFQKLEFGMHEKINRRLLISGIIVLGGSYFLFCHQPLFIKVVSLLSGYNLTVKQCVWIEKNFFGFMIRVILAGGLIYLWQKKKESKIIQGFILFFIVVDLFAFGWGINPLARNNFFKLKPSNVNLVRQHLGQGRFFLDPDSQSNRLLFGQTFEEKYLSLRQALVPNAGVPYHLPYVYEYGYFTIKDYKDLLLEAKSFPSIFDSSIIDMLGGKVILSYKKLTHPKLTFLKQNYIGFYDNTTALSRVWLVGAFKQMPRGKILAYLSSVAFDPRQEIVVAEDVKINELSHDLPIKPKVKIEETHDSDKLVINYSSVQPGYLVVNDVYYPGWRAWLDDLSSPIIKANYILRAMLIPAGQHQVRFSYQPISFYIGLLITVSALLMLSIYFVYWAGRRL